MDKEDVVYVYTMQYYSSIKKNEKRPAHRDEEWPPLATTRESPRTEMKTQHSHK